MKRLLSILVLLCLSARAQFDGLVTTNALDPYSAIWKPFTNGWIGRCGVPQGAENMDTNYTFWCDPTKGIPGTNIVVATDGVTDNSMAFKAMTSRQPVGTYIFMPPGYYPATNGFTIGSYRQFRGAAKYGVNQTLFGYRSPVGAGKSQNSIFINLATSKGAQTFGQIPITSDCHYGTNTFTALLHDVSNVVYQLGQHAFPGGTNFLGYICQTNDHHLVSLFGYANQYAPQGGNDAMSQMVKIVKVTTNGATCTLTTEDPFIWPWALTNSPIFVPITSPCVGASVEHIAVIYLNTNAGLSGGCFEINGGYRSAVIDCLAINGVEDCVTVANSYKCTIRYNGAYNWQYSQSGQGYDFHGAGPQSQNEWTANWSVGGSRHFIIFEGGGSANFVAYNFGSAFEDYHDSPNYTYDDMDLTHASHPFLNDYECNNGEKYRFDSEHGSASHNTVLRCVATMGGSNIANGAWSYLVKTNIGQVAFKTPLTYSTNLTAFGAFGVDKTNYYNNFLGDIAGGPFLTNFPGAVFFEANTSQPWIFGLGFGSNNPVSSDGEGSSHLDDPTVAAKTFIDGTVSFLGGSPTVVWKYGTNRYIPPSLALTAAPAWWPNNIAWPPYGPDVTNCTGALIYADTNHGPAYLDFINFTNQTLITASGNGNCGGGGGGGPPPPVATNSVQYFWMHVRNDMPALWKRLTNPQKS